MAQDVKTKRATVAHWQRLAQEYRTNNGNLTQEVARLRAEVGEKERECQAAKLELVRRDEVIAGLTKELDESRRNAEGLVSRFLESRAFKEAVPLAALDMMRGAMYGQLKDLGQYYPFTPEQVRYDEVPEEKTKEAWSLSGYGWDQEADCLLTPTGRVTETTIEMNTQDPYIVHPWRGRYSWPADLNAPESGSGSGEESDEEDQLVDLVHREMDREDPSDQANPDVAPQTVISKSLHVVSESTYDTAPSTSQ